MNYDTFNLRLSNDYYSQHDLCTLRNKLEDPVESKNSKYGYSVKGMINGAQLYCSSTSIKLDKTSLPRVIKGSNDKQISLNEVKLYIESLSDNLYLPMDKAVVSKIHFCHDYNTDYAPSRYLLNFDRMPRYKKQAYECNGVRYKQSSKAFKAYDKVAEMKIKHNKDAVNLKCNMLRLENEYNSRLKRQLKQFKLTADCLYSEDFYNYNIDQLKNNYFKVKKNRDQRTTLCPISMPKEMKEILISEGLKRIGKEDLIEQVKSWRENDLISYSTKYRTIEFIESIGTGVDHNTTDLIDELDKKVRQAAINYRL